MTANKTMIAPVWLAVVLLLTQARVCGQPKAPGSDSVRVKKKYALNISLGGGVSVYTGLAGAPPDLPVRVNTFYGNGSFRIMWHPDHLLRMGLETGLAEFYAYHIQGTPAGGVSVKGIPMLLVFSMPLANRISLFAGSGAYLIISQLDYQGYRKASSLNLGWMLAGSYQYPIGKKLGLAAELKWLNEYATKDALITLQIQLRWKFLQW